jgi:hypothetical protein
VLRGLPEWRISNSQVVESRSVDEKNIDALAVYLQ